MKKETRKLTEGNIYRGLAAFVIPMILGSLIQQLYITVDAVIVGQFTGKIGLAAIDSVHTLFKFPINFMNGLSAGATILISGYFGAKDKESLHKCVRSAVTLAMGLGVVCSILGALFAPQLMHLMSVPGDIYDQTLLYSRIYFGGLWSMILYNMAAGILRAFGDSRRPLTVLILSSLFNILADLLLVGGLRLGVAGAAAATVFSQMVSVVCVFYFLEKQEQKDGEERVWLPRFSSTYMRNMVWTGFPLALQSMLFPVANSIVQASVNGMGTDAIAAWGVCGKLDLLIWLVADSMSPALSTYTAQNIGAGKQDRVRKGVLTGTAMSVGTVALISLVLYFFSGTMGGWFVSSADAAAIVPLVVKYMTIMAPFYVFYAVAEAFSGACCGTGDTLRPMITTLTTICLLRVVSIWFILPRFGTMECIVWIYVTSWIVAGLSFAGLYWYEMKRIALTAPG